MRRVASPGHIHALTLARALSWDPQASGLHSETLLVASVGFFHAECFDGVVFGMRHTAAHTNTALIAHWRHVQGEHTHQGLRPRGHSA